MKTKKIFLLGIDGLSKKVFFSFLKDGVMPHFKRQVEKGIVVDVIPNLPPLTAPGWLSIASGMNPSTIGVENIFLPIAGKPLNMIENGFNSRLSKVKYVWDIMGEQGMPSIVLKYPGTWPPREGNYIQIDGAGGYADISCVFEVSPSEAFITKKQTDTDSSSKSESHLLFPEGYKSHWRINTSPLGSIISLFSRKPLGWENLPEDIRPIFEVTLPLSQKDHKAKQIIFALAFQKSGKGHVLLSKSKNYIQPLDILKVGQWGKWQREESKIGLYAYRFKLIQLDFINNHLHLYKSEGHCLDGFTRPAELASQLVEAVGPVVEWAGTYDYMNGLIDLETQLEIYQNHTKWLADSIKYLSTHYKWIGFFTQWHPIEYAHHIVGASLEKDHPYYKEENRKRDIEFLKAVYKQADYLLQIVESVIDEDTLLVLASDHGHDFVHSLFYINNFLLEKGYLTLSEKNKPATIDWSRTTAYGLFPGCIFLNTKDRWIGGIVSSKETARITRGIREDLMNLIDPAKERHPVRVVLDKEEMLAFGHKGLQAPDLFVCMDKGYEVASRLKTGNKKEIFEITQPYKEITSGHGSFFPLSESARTVAIFSGLEEVNTQRIQYPISVKDITPTILSFLNISQRLKLEGESILLKL